jgi:hypothetical protein
MPTSLPSCGSTVRAHASFSARNLCRPAGPIDAPHRRAVGCRISRDIKICRLAGVHRKLRLRQQREPRDRVEGCFRFAPLDAGVFDPEAGIPVLAPIGHPVDVEELDPKVEAAHVAILLEVPD